MNQCILSIERVFQDSSYPIRSIPKCLNFLIEKEKDLILNKDEEFKKLVETWDIFNKIDFRNTKIELSTFISTLKENIPNVKKDDSLSKALVNLKTIRDKTIGHNERVIPKEEYSILKVELDNLINFSKKFVAVVGWGLVGYEYKINGLNTLSNDAKFRTSPFKELLDDAKI